MQLAPDPFDAIAAGELPVAGVDDADRNFLALVEQAQLTCFASGQPGLCGNGILEVEAVYADRPGLQVQATGAGVRGQGG